MHAPDRSAGGSTGLVVWGVFALTVVGAVIRYLGFHESLFNDELSTYAGVKLSGSPGELLHLLRADETLMSTGRYVIELTPPLYFLLAWVTSHLGDAPEWIRLSDIVCGVLTIPIVYMVGVRTIGQRAALFGTVLATFSPYLIYESNDARAYMVATFLVMFTAWLVLRALEAGHLGWWVGYAAATTAVIYTHYTAALSLIAIAVWALIYYRDHWKPLVLANVAAGIAFLPWLGEFLDDGKSPYNLIATLFPVTFDYLGDVVGEWTIGSATALRSAVPGDLAVGLIVSGVVLAIAGSAYTLARRLGERRGFRPPPGPTLVVLLALAMPVGLGVYSVLGDDVIIARYMVISSPGLMLVGGMLLAAPPMPLRALAAALVIAGFAIGGIRTVSHYGARPDYKAAAEYIEQNTRPGTPVLNRNIFLVREGPVSTGLAVNLDDEWPISYPLNVSDKAAGLDADEFVLVWFAPPPGPTNPTGPSPDEPIPPQIELVKSRVFPGSKDVGVYIYERR